MRESARDLLENDYDLLEKDRDQDLGFSGGVALRTFFYFCHREQTADGEFGTCFAKEFLP